MKNLIYISLFLLFACSKNADLTKVQDDFVNQRPNVVIEENKLKLEWSEAALDFPATPVNSTVERILILTNKGTSKTAPLQINLVNNVSPFSLDNDENQCLGKELDPKESCSLVVQFTPTSNDLQNNVLSATDLITSSSVVLGGSGTGGTSTAAPAANLIWFLSDYNFGSLATGSQQHFDFILVNIGGQNSALISTSLENNPSDFSITNGFNFCENQILTSGSSCKVRVVFNPQSVGVKSNKLVATSGSQEIKLDLIGQGVFISSQLAFELVSYDFNHVVLGQEKSFNIVLRNNSVINSSNVSLTWNNSDNFSIVSGFDNCSGSILVGGGQCSVRIRFYPIVTGQDLSGVLTATDGFSTSSISFIGDSLDPNSQNPIAFNQNFALVEDSVFNSFLMTIE